MSSSTLERTTSAGTARPSRVPTTGRATSTTKAGARSRAEVAARSRTKAERTADRAAGRAAATDASGGTAPFVLLIMVLLTSGLVATLWLSTAAAAATDLPLFFRNSRLLSFINLTRDDYFCFAYSLYRSAIFACL